MYVSIIYFILRIFKFAYYTKYNVKKILLQIYIMI